jgi:hypothetical protein
MSDLLKEMISCIGVEYLSVNGVKLIEQEKYLIDPSEEQIFPDFDHVTVI